MMTIIEKCPQCSKSLDSPDVFCPKCRFPLQPVGGRFRIEKHLASGGFGIVYTAKDLKNGGIYALKVIKVENLSFDAQAHKHLSKRFFREAEVTEKIAKQSQHVVHIFAHGDDPNYGLFYVMELLEGHPLEEKLKNNTPLPLKEALRVFKQICLGMQEAHRQGIVHRDLKPDNIFLVEKEGNSSFVKILDFGIAKKFSGTIETQLTQGVIGTPHYLSPEQCLGDTITPQTDIYSMGIMLFQLLTGLLPFTGDTSIALLTAHMMQETPRISTCQPELNIPVEFDSILFRALNKKPEQRYESVEDFWLALAPFYAPEENMIDCFGGTFELSNTALGLAQEKSSSTVPQKPKQLPKPSPLPSTHSSISMLEFQQMRWLNIVVVIGMLFSLLLGGMWTWKHHSASDLKKHSTFVAKAVRPIVQIEQEKRPLPSHKTPTKKRTPKPKIKNSRPTVIRERPRKRLFAHKTKVHKKRRIRKPRKLRIRRRTQPKPSIVKVATKSPNSRVCGTLGSSWRWVIGQFIKPKEGMNSQVYFLKCPMCQKKKRAGQYCLKIPKRRTVFIRVKAKGFQSCRHKLSTSTHKVRWYLKLSNPDDIINERYKCNL